MLLGAGVALLQAACTHTTRVDPNGPATSIEAVQAALAGRRAVVATVDGGLMTTDHLRLTSDEITGTTVPSAESFTAPLDAVRQISFKSRTRGAWDCFLIGAATNTIGLAAIVADEGGRGSDWSLLPLAAGLATLPYVVLGTLMGSTIRFEIGPGR